MNVDALVIGAGPAGTAAARTLAQEGVNVALVDRYDFPRDKVCGDALIPDALTALAELGIKQDVLRAARQFNAVRIYSPNHAYVELRGVSACIPRLAFDDLLRTAAIDAGAHFHPHLRVVEPLVADGRVSGARFEETRTRDRIDIHARCTILATGAASDVLTRFGVCLRSTASATAARVYVKVPTSRAAQWDHLCIAYSKSICPGYGWIFPGPDDLFNVGVGYYYDVRNLPRERNVRTLLATFLEEFPPAVDLMKASVPVTDLKGAPLRTAMQGALPGRPGLLVAGEAAGMTYSFSGEGIGKALQSGIIASRVALRHGLDASSAAVEAYRATLDGEFSSRFRAYQTLQRWLAHPAFLNLLARRARSGSYLRRELEELFNETGNPQELVSLRGIVKALVS